MQDTVVTTIQTLVGSMFIVYSHDVLRIANGVALSLAVIKVAMFGWQLMYGRIHGGMDAWTYELLRTGAVILFVTLALRYWMTPMPDVGVTFPGLIVDGPAQIAERIDRHAERIHRTNLESILGGVEVPGRFHLMQGMAYLVLSSAVAAAAAIGGAVIGFSLAAIGIAVMVGPLFVAMLLFDPLKYMFYGWLKTLISLAMLKIVLAAMIAVGLGMIATTSRNWPNLVSFNDFFVYFYQMIVALLVYIAMPLSAPYLTHSFMSGMVSHSHAGMSVVSGWIARR